MAVQSPAAPVMRSNCVASAAVSVRADIEIDAGPEFVTVDVWVCVGPASMSSAPKASAPGLGVSSVCVPVRRVTFAAAARVSVQGPAPGSGGLGACCVPESTGAGTVAGIGSGVGAGAGTATSVPVPVSATVRSAAFEAIVSVAAFAPVEVGSKRTRSVTGLSDGQRRGGLAVGGIVGQALELRRVPDSVRPDSVTGSVPEFVSVEVWPAVGPSSMSRDPNASAAGLGVSSV